MSDEWEPPKSDYALREEKAPWGRRIAAIVVLAVIAVGAIWLASKVVVPDELPVDDPTEEGVPDDDVGDGNAPAEEPDKPLTDDEAWVAALEKDTLEGYREYLAQFPEGNHKEDAQAEIDKYDERDWQTALERGTLAGYEDYLEAWPEGLHASEAREKIAEIKA
ncbi:MAG: hypothetical protein ABJG15_17620, partial [Hyphomonadaceae bacterium]